MKRNIKGIAREALEFALQVSASSHPKEFAGMLYETNDIITHVDVPITQSSKVSAVMDLFMLPVNPHLIGTIHSHPSGILTPSDADIKMFVQSGPCHIIVGYPYDMQSWMCYDRGGNTKALEVLDVEIDEPDLVYDDIRETFGGQND